MKASKTLLDKVKLRIKKRKDRIFVLNDFYDFVEKYDYDQVLRALRTLVKEGLLIKIGQGIYAKTKIFSNGMVALCANIGDLACEALKKLGIKRDCLVSDYNFDYFSESELDKIKTLFITGLDSIQFLRYLPNLEKLQIISDDYTNVLEYGSYKDNPRFNDISSFNVLKKLTKLKYLEITNDVNIESIDLSNMSELKTLILRNNPQLKTIIGADKLHKLETIIIVGNPIRNFEGFEYFLANTLDAKENVVDVDVYLSSVKTSKQAKDIYDYSLMGLYSSNITFAEKCDIGDYTTMNIKEMTDLYRNLLRRISKVKLKDQVPATKIEYLYKYAVGIPFDIQGIKRRNDEYIKLYQQYNGMIPEFYQKSLNYLHSSYATYQLHKGNCEGIVNLMHYMASLLDIDSQTVHCHDRRSNIYGSNHALIRFKTIEGWKYYDPTYDRENHDYYKDMNLKEVEEYADLPKIEHIINRRERYNNDDYTRTLHK